MRSRVARFASVAFPTLLAACSPLAQPEASSDGESAAAITPNAPASAPPQAGSE